MTRPLIWWQQKKKVAGLLPPFIVCYSTDYLPGCTSGRSFRKYIELEDLYQQQAYSQRNNGCYQARHHERVVQDVLTDACRTGTVEVNGCDYGRIVRDEEVTVYSRDQGDEHHR